jgi:uncharacterized protein
MEKITDLQRLIDTLGLEPHPEGGFYAETYRCETSFGEGDNKRSVGTAIYYLLGAGDRSRFHRLKSDELWHFYSGSPVDLFEIDGSTGALEHHLLGPSILDGQRPQIIITAGTWFAASVIEGGEYTLAGCTVSPGFDFRDFELATREQLVRASKHNTDIISKFT